MTVIQLDDEYLAVIAANRNLRRYLGSLNTERDYTPRSWLWDGKHGNPYLAPDDVLDIWEQMLNVGLVHGNAFEREILAFDLDSKSKWGPQGGHPPMDAVFESHVLPSYKRSEQSTRPPAFESPEWERAKSNVSKLYQRMGIHSLRPASPEAVVMDLVNEHQDRLASNSGWPAFSKRKLPEVIAQAIASIHSGEYLDFPAIVLFRRYNGKLRLVWMFPFAANIAEAQFYTPVFNAMRAKPELVQRFYAPWTGFEQVRQRVSDMYGAQKIVVASDFSSTDEHFTLDTSMEVVDVLSSLFQRPYREDFERTVQHMHEINLLVSPTQMVTGLHGVSSGSNYTNFIETVFDNILAEYARIISAGKVRGLYAIGDDMAWVVEPSFLDAFPEWLQEVGRSVGQDINASKTNAYPDKVKSLQRLFQRGYYQEGSKELLRGVYPTIRALKSLVYPERWHNPRKWSYDMFALRTFMILENTVDHPLFKEFVSFVTSGSPRLLTWVKKRDAALDAIQRKGKLLVGLVPTYNQEKKESRLSTFQSIDVARKL